MPLGERLDWQEDAAGRLLVVDFGNTTKEEANGLFELFDAAVRAEPEGSLRLLADFNGAFHAPDLTQRWKVAAAVHEKHIRMAALTGVHGGVKVAVMAYRFYLRLRGVDVARKMRLFEKADEAAARAWLETDGKSA